MTVTRQPGFLMRMNTQEAIDLIDGVQNQIKAPNPLWDVCVAIHKLVAELERQNRKTGERIANLERLLAARC